eukprot:scaffold132394_cov17-Tisochrysis_lutea.AAC.1
MGSDGIVASENMGVERWAAIALLHVKRWMLGQCIAHAANKGKSSRGLCRHLLHACAWTGANPPMHTSCIS